MINFFRCFSIKWGKDGKDYLTLPGKSSTTEIRELERVTSKLRIGGAAQEDAGQYSCQASNAFGTSHFGIDVTIWGTTTSICIFIQFGRARNKRLELPMLLLLLPEPPPTPQNLSILDIQSRSVKVAWTVEMASPAVDRLVVQWKEQAGKNESS